ncbi:MAG: DUF3500 domain-containing protein [Desulfobacterales bacterium]
MNIKPENDITDAAGRFLSSFTPEQRKTLSFSFDSKERFDWDYRPRNRAGLALKDMDGAQQQFAYALIASGLSLIGNIKALAIMSLEKTLAESEGKNVPHVRDPLEYYICLFGEPSGELPWALRVEGHHLSLNLVISKAQGIAATPNFFGANPATVIQGPLSGLRVLADEEDKARRLLASLSETQQQRAVIASQAPADIVTQTEKRVKIDEPVGLAVSEMADDQEIHLMDLIATYTGRMPRDVEDAYLNQIEKEGRAHIHFAWAGSTERNRPHYYRVHGPGFLMEYDNTQNNANHIHSVWRDFKNDWGGDMLKKHYTNAH